MKKRLIALVLCLTMLVAGGAAMAEGQSYTPGTYEGKAQGMGGEVIVTMTFDANSITDVTAVGDNETPGIGSLALEQLPSVILEAQSLEVDAISTATATSTAILTAAKFCVDQAMGLKTGNDVVTDETADVIVVGAGAAGLSAAASAVESGASVIVLETNSFIGGAAGMSMGNLVDLRAESYTELERNDASLEVYATLSEDFFPEPWKTDYIKLMEQIEEYTNNGKEKGRFVTIERIMVDHYKKGMGMDEAGNVKDVSLDYDIIRSGIENAQDIYSWLVGYGLSSTPTPRMEYCTTPVPLVEGGKQGAGLIKVLAHAAEGAEIRLSTRATELVTDENGKVVGVIAEDADGNRITFHANGGVVLATGGFSGNAAMVTKYFGAEQEPSDWVPASNVGDGIVMAEAQGAQLRDMAYMSNYLTFGGLVVDTDSRVLNTEGNVIEGLYAAGDVCSGVEGSAHQSGNNMTILINMGRTAGINAASSK